MKYSLALSVLLLTPLAAARAASEVPAAPLGAELNLDQYIVELDHWAVTAKTLEFRPEKAAKIRDALPKEWRVEYRGEHYAVPTAWLRTTLNSLQVNHWLAADYSKEIQKHLATMRAEAEALATPPAVPPGVSQNKLHDILSRREFREVAGPTWLDRLREKIADWLDELLERLFGGILGHPALGNVLLWTLVAGLSSLLIILLLRNFLKAGGKLDLKLDSFGPASRSWKDWGMDALAAAARGDYREAIRLSYWAGIFRLEELGLWQVDRARTHREYLRLLASNDSHRLPLAALTNRFEVVWYGGAPASAEDFENVVTQLETLGCRLRLNPATANS